MFRTLWPTVGVDRRPSCWPRTLSSRQTCRNLVAKLMKIDLRKTFSDEFQKEVTLCGFEARSIAELYRAVIASLDALPKDLELTIEYIHQSTGERISEKKIEFDEVWLISLLGQYVDEWAGRKTVQGVYPNQAWKCGMCFFADHCQWRLARLNPPSFPAQDGTSSSRTDK